mgnify:CR=1 FL=1
MANTPINNEEEIALPTKTEDLIKLLNKLFPEQSPNLTDNPKNLYFQAGQRDVVRFLNHLQADLKEKFFKSKS